MSFLTVIDETKTVGDLKTHTSASIYFQEDNTHTLTSNKMLESMCYISKRWSTKLFVTCVLFWYKWCDCFCMYNNKYIAKSKHSHELFCHPFLVLFITFFFIICYVIKTNSNVTLRENKGWQLFTQHWYLSQYSSSTIPHKSVGVLHLKY